MLLHDDMKAILTGYWGDDTR